MLLYMCTRTARNYYTAWLNRDSQGGGADSEDRAGHISRYVSPAYTLTSLHPSAAVRMRIITAYNERVSVQCLQLPSGQYVRHPENKSYRNSMYEILFELVDCRCRRQILECCCQ